MKAMLEFNLLEEKEDFNCALKGYDLRMCLQEIDNWLRNKIKYSEEREEMFKGYEAVRDELTAICLNRDVDLW